MAGEANLSLLGKHSVEEAEARVAGDAASSLTAVCVRMFVPAGVTVTVPERWSIVAVKRYEIEEGGLLDLQADAYLEVLA